VFFVNYVNSYSYAITSSGDSSGLLDHGPTLLLSYELDSSTPVLGRTTIGFQRHKSYGPGSSVFGRGSQSPSFRRSKRRCFRQTVFTSFRKTMVKTNGRLDWNGHCDRAGVR